MEYSVANTDEIDSVVPEEVYLVVDGEVTVQLGGTETDFETEVILDAGEAIRVAPETRRQLQNRGDERVRVVIAGSS